MASTEIYPYVTLILGIATFVFSVVREVLGSEPSRLRSKILLATGCGLICAGVVAFLTGSRSAHPQPAVSSVPPDPPKRESTVAVREPRPLAPPPTAVAPANTSPTPAVPSRSQTKGSSRHRPGGNSFSIEGNGNVMNIGSERAVIQINHGRTE